MAIIHKKDTLLTITLMVTIMIDVMGMGLIFPIYPDLFYNPSYALIDVHMASGWHNFLYGLALAAWPIGLFLGAPYFGDLSDKISRKNVIFICLIGVVATYGVSIIAVDHKSYALFLVSRFFSGVFGGSFPIAQAMMIDISTEKTKARNLSLITLAASFGFVIGPVITSISTLEGVADWMTITTPFYVAAAMSLINAVSVWYLLPKRPPSDPNATINLWKSIAVIYEALVDLRTRRLLTAFLLLFVGWGFYVTIVALVLYQHFHFTTSGVAVVYALMATSNIFFTLVVRPVMFRHLNHGQVCFVTGVVVALLVLLAAWTKYIAIQWLVAALAPGMQVLFYTAILVLLSDSVSDTEQGRVMGSADAAASFAWAFNSLMTGLLIDINLLLPLVVGAVFVIAGGLFFLPRSLAKR